MRMGALVNAVRRRCGLTNSDAAELLFDNDRTLGFGLRSFTASHVAATTRELEVLLNGTTPTAFVGRGRLTSMRNRHAIPNDASNFVERATKLIGKFGIYVRDNKDCELTNRMMDLPDLTYRRVSSLGQRSYREKGTKFGEGKPALEAKILGATKATQVAAAIKAWTTGAGHDVTDLERPQNWNTATPPTDHPTTPNEPRIDTLVKPTGISAKNLATALKQAIKDLDNDASGLYHYWEWRASADRPDEDPFTSKENWRYCEATTIGIYDLPESDPYTLTQESMEIKVRLDATKPEDAYILRIATADGTWPMMLATDGGHTTKDTELGNSFYHPPSAYRPWRNQVATRGTAPSAHSHHTTPAKHWIEQLPQRPRGTTSTMHEPRGNPERPTCHPHRGLAH